MRRSAYPVAALTAVALLTCWGDKPAPAQDPSQPAIKIDSSQAVARYTNFSQVIGTPEEMIIDFGLNPRGPAGKPEDGIRIDQRVVMNYYTAKRLSLALQKSLQRHEEMFGEIEIDIRKRARENTRLRGT